LVSRSRGPAVKQRATGANFSSKLGTILLDLDAWRLANDVEDLLGDYGTATKIALLIVEVAADAKSRNLFPARLNDPSTARYARLHLCCLEKPTPYVAQAGGVKFIPSF
jgi:hypothetical protein